MLFITPVRQQTEAFLPISSLSHPPLLFRGPLYTIVAARMDGVSPGLAAYISLRLALYTIRAINAIRNRRAV